jgi:hypothetical protein
VSSRLWAFLLAMLLLVTGGGYVVSAVMSNPHFTPQVRLTIMLVGLSSLGLCATGWRMRQDLMGKALLVAGVVTWMFGSGVGFGPV